MKYAIIHIADIHYRKNEPEGVSTVFNAFIEDVTKQKKQLLSYNFYIAITGDLVYAGDDAESYDSFIEEFDKKFDDIGLSKNFRIIVPGNHDIERSKLKPNLKEYQDKYYEVSNIEQKFNDHINCETNNESKFENYELFESDFVKHGIDYCPQGKGWTLNNDIGVYCLNTALGSFGGLDEIKDDGKLAIYTRGLVNWCNSNTKSTNILLMHHPLSHLNEWSQEELRQIIENNFALCLSGHKHKQDLLYNRISKKSLICSAPQLFTSKEDDLGYAIILIEDNSIDKIIYRQYIHGKFLNGIKFSGNDEGIITLQNDYLKNRDMLEGKLKNALKFFKGQPEVFILPKLSIKREFNDNENLLNQVILEPYSSIIVA